jgi:hypothetical protein
MRNTLVILFGSVAMMLLLPPLGGLADSVWTVVVTAAAAASAATGSFSAAAVTLAGDTDRLVGMAVGLAAATVAVGMAVYARLVLIPVSVEHARIEPPRPAPVAEVVPLPVRRPPATSDRRSA